jgi:hypothetical protein
LVLITERGIEGETINLAGKEKISINKIAQYARQLGVTGVRYIPDRKMISLTKMSAFSKPSFSWIGSIQWPTTRELAQ